MPRAGRYRDRVSVERKGGDLALDDFGNATAPAWAVLAEFWGNLRETTGKEHVAAGRLEAPATATLRLRRSAESLAITAADRVVARGAVWAITSAPIDPDGTRREVEVLLARGVAVQ